MKLNERYYIFWKFNDNDIVFEVNKFNYYSYSYSYNFTVNTYGVSEISKGKLCLKGKYYKEILHANDMNYRSFLTHWKYPFSGYDNKVLNQFDDKLIEVMDRIEFDINKRNLPI